jgi:acyl-CoA hydrolase
MTEMVMPNDTNNLANLMGGNLMRWMDICAAIAAGKHANCIAVTAAVDNVSFRQPIKQGAIVTLTSRVTRAFRTSLEVYIEVFTEDLNSQEKVLANTAYFTFVAIDKEGKPTPVAAVRPESAEEKRQFEGAQRRREIRLVLGGRVKPQDAHALRELFGDSDKK